MKTSSRELFILTIIILATFFIRLLLLWVWRPEFVGWFNHTYYYYVETRGMLRTGTLPFPDMPLLFYIYTFTAKALTWIGIDQSIAIVSSTRFWMCTIASLTPWPAYLIIRSINKDEIINWRHWVLVASSAVLPLNLVHAPEFSQKSVLGIFLLTWFIYLTKKALETNAKKNLAYLGLTFTLIVLTHFGTTAVAVLFLISTIIAYSLMRRNRGRSWKILALGLLLILISLFLIHALDVERFHRIGHYLSASYEHSFVASLISAETSLVDKLISGAVITLPVLMAFFMYKSLTKINHELSVSDYVFWVALILFFYLLVLPIYDKQLLGRFTMFLSLPVLFILAYLLKYANWRPLVKNTVSIGVAIGVSMLAFGEYMSLKMHNRNSQDVFTDLMLLKQQITFDQNDLIITKNGAEHICNWFLETKSAVITAHHRSDFEQYHDVYILNPIEGQLNFGDLNGKRADNEKDRYLFMLRNTPKPQNAEVKFESEHLQLLKLESPPDEWEYSQDGYWCSYERSRIPLAAPLGTP